MNLIQSNSHREYALVLEDSISALHSMAARCYHLAVELYMVRTVNNAALEKAAQSQSVVMVNHEAMYALKEPAISTLLDAQMEIEKILDEYEEDDLDDVTM